MGDANKKKRRRRNRRRRRRRRNKSRAMVRAGSRLPKPVRLCLEAGPLEIAAGYDGLLRGKPEPAVIVAAYHRTDDAVKLLVRTLFRYAVGANPPCRAEPADVPDVWSPRTQLVPGSLVILVIAVEEDSGRDVQALYAALDDVDQLVVWPLEGRESVPSHLGDVPSIAPEGVAVQVGLQAPGGPPIDAFEADDYVGTAALWLPSAGLRRRSDHRGSIRSRDGRNDWTAQFWLVAR